MTNQKKAEKAIMKNANNHLQKCIKQHTQASKDKTSKSMMGNKNAEKYNEEECNRLMDLCIVKAEEVIEDDKSFEYKHDFIGEVYRSAGIYHHLVEEWIGRFPYLQEKKDRLKKQMELNCYYNSKKGKINTAIGIVNLKSNHRWSDRVDMTSGDKKIETTVIKSLDEAKALTRDQLDESLRNFFNK